MRTRANAGDGLCVCRRISAGIVGAPAYFESHAKPASPRDLLQHRCMCACSKIGVRRSQFFLDFPSCKQQPAPLAALIDKLRLEGNQRK
jgi:hypothetical protein